MSTLLETAIIFLIILPVGILAWLYIIDQIILYWKRNIR